VIPLVHDITLYEMYHFLAHPVYILLILLMFSTINKYSIPVVVVLIVLAWHSCARSVHIEVKRPKPTRINPRLSEFSLHRLDAAAIQGISNGHRL